MKLLYLAPFFLPLSLGFDFTVGVGKDETTGKKGLGFDPSVINPVAGDVIVFEFRSGSHSVVQSSFDRPCTSNGGFNSGVQTVADNLAVDAPGLPTVKLVVNDTQPLWFFDEAGGLCHKGAVLAANPSGTQTTAAFKENAAKDPGAPSTPSASSSPTSGAISGSGSAPASSPTSNSAVRAGTSGIGIVLMPFILGFF